MIPQLVSKLGLPEPDVAGEELAYELRLDGETLMLPPVEESSALPDWTRLRHRQCSNCPLREADHPRCPVAVQTIPVVEAFRTHLSHEIAAVEVDSPNRVYRRNASLQEALSSLLVIHMVASGCPVLGKLRPMLTTHLPFMSSEESTFRLVSTYLLAQYAIAFGLAMLLNADIRARKFLRVVFLMPFMLSPVAVSWMVGKSIMEYRFGPAATLARHLG